MKKMSLTLLTLLSVSLLSACVSEQVEVPTVLQEKVSLEKPTVMATTSKESLSTSSSQLAGSNSAVSSNTDSVRVASPNVTAATSKENVEVADYQDLTQSSEVSSESLVSGDNIALESYEDLTQTSELSTESVVEVVSTETSDSIQENTVELDYQPQLNALWSGDYSSIAGTWKDNLGNQVTVDSAGVVYIYPSNAKWGGVQYPFLMLTAGGSSYGQLTYTASLTDKTAYDLVQAGEEGFGGAGMPGIMYAKDGAGERLYLTPNGTEVGFNVLTRVG